ncbi:MAG: histidine kinase [Gammaproteobacteria bacterium]
MFSKLASGKADYLPDFCKERAVLAVVISAELLALVVALVLETKPGAGFLVNIGLISVYVQWIGLVCAALLCWLRRRFSFQSSQIATLVAISLILGTIAVVSEFAWQFDRWLEVLYISASHLEFMIKNLVIGLIIGSLLLRNFFLQHERQLSVERQAAAQLEALHARIRPHFLFNTLNTIIAIVQSKPVLAETALQDLSGLMRVALRVPEDFIELSKELEIVHMYTRIEQLRLGKRLDLKMDVDVFSAESLAQRVPALVLQPLVENAVYHGIEPLASGGKIVVQGNEYSDRIEVVVTNDKASTSTGSGSGQHLGLDSVRQRLELAFGSRARCTISDAADRFTCTVVIPKTEPLVSVANNKPT